MMKIANSMFCASMRLSLLKASPEAKVLIEAALENPCPKTTRAVLLASVGQTWRPLIEGALIEIGIACSSNVECSK